MIAVDAPRVLERLVYEGLLLHNQLHGRRWRVTLADLLRAGAAEPRVWELLPGIILHYPTMIFRLRRDLPHCAELAQLLSHFATAPATQLWRGCRLRDLRIAAARIAAQRQHRRRTQRWRNINIRLSEVDLQRLNTLAVQQQQSKSDLLRRLIAGAGDLLRRAATP